jgi:hypothetical protein
MVKILRPLPLNLRRRDALEVLRKYARDPNAVPRLWAGAGDRTYAFDRNNQLSDNAAAYTAAGYSQVDGADAVVDLGGNQAAVVTLPPIADVATIKPQLARIDAVIWISVLAITGGVSFLVVGSNDPVFGAGNVAQLGQMQVGAGASQPNPIPAPAIPGGSGIVYEILFTNEQANQKYQYLKLYNLAPTSINYRAFLAVLPEE